MKAIPCPAGMVTDKRRVSRQAAAPLNRNGKTLQAAAYQRDLIVVPDCFDIKSTIDRK